MTHFVTVGPGPMSAAGHFGGQRGGGSRQCGLMGWALEFFCQILKAIATTNWRISEAVWKA